VIMLWEIATPDLLKQLARATFRQRSVAIDNLTANVIMVSDPNRVAIVFCPDTTNLVTITTKATGFNPAVWRLPVNQTPLYVSLFQYGQLVQQQLFAFTNVGALFLFFTEIIVPDFKL